MKLIGIGATLKPEYDLPPCLPRQEIEFIKGCFKTPSDPACLNYRRLADYGRRMDEAQLCDPNYVPYPLGACQDPWSTAALAYYNKYKWYGPDGAANAWAWHAHHVPGWLNMLALVQAVPCGGKVATRRTIQPTAVSCLTSAHVAQIQQCFINPNAPGCSTVFTSKMRNTPLCPDVPRAPIPECLDATMQAGVDYCEKHGWGGPDAGLNALCWAGMRDRNWYNELKGRPICGGAPDVTPEPIGPGPSIETEEEPIGPAVEYYQPPEPIEPAPSDDEKTMWIVGGVIGAVALVGVGYLLLRKKKAG